MPDATQMLAFFLAAIVLAAIPGPGLLYVLARSLGGGRDVGLRSSLGTGLGGCVHVRMLIEGREPSLRGLGGRGADVGAFRQGVITEALNPKTALFFVSFLPRFARPEAGPLAVRLALLGGISVALNTFADVLVALAAGRLGQRLMATPRFWRRQRKLSGGLLVGLGAYAAASDRA